MENKRQEAPSASSKPSRSCTAPFWVGRNDADQTHPNSPRFVASHRGNTSNVRKNPHAHKNKIGTSTPPFQKQTQKPPPPPLKGGILWAWGFSCRKNQKMPDAHKIGAAISGPELRAEILWTSRLFLKYRSKHVQMCTLSLGMIAVWPAQIGLCKFGRVWSLLTPPRSVLLLIRMKKHIRVSFQIWWWVGKSFVIRSLKVSHQRNVLLPPPPQKKFLKYKGGRKNDESIRGHLIEGWMGSLDRFLIWGSCISTWTFSVRLYAPPVPCSCRKLGRREKTYTPKVCSALKTQVPQPAKQRFGVYQKACFQGKEKENTCTPKSLQGVCGGPLRAVLVYRFWPPTWAGTPHRTDHLYCLMRPSWVNIRSSHERERERETEREREIYVCILGWLEDGQTDRQAGRETDKNKRERPRHGQRRR